MTQRVTRNPSGIGRRFFSSVVSILVFGAAPSGMGRVMGDECPAAQWDDTFGGVLEDTTNAVQPTADGGAIVVGTTLSYGAGGRDVYPIKIDADGNRVWEKIFGGFSDDMGNSVQQTADGSYIVAGGTRSFGAGNTDAFLIKVDAEGNSLWEPPFKTFGGTELDAALSVQQTHDGGYILAGLTRSYGEGGDVYLIKTDANGNIDPDDPTTTWEKNFGGPGFDIGRHVQQTADGGYVVVGASKSDGNTILDAEDVYLLKTDSTGQLEWDARYGGGHIDVGFTVQQTDDDGDGERNDGYIIGAGTLSFPAPQSTLGQAYLVKTKANGMLDWQRTYGGAGHEDAYGGAWQTVDGGFILAGSTSSFGDEDGDFYLAKTDQNGELICQTSLGGAGADTGRAMRPTADGGYLLAGSTESFGAGGQDIWVIRTEPLKPLEPVFRRGDTDADTEVNLTDAVFTLTWLFLGGSAPGCRAAANVNGDEEVDLSDPVSLLSHLFLGGPAPAEPFLECGPGRLDADDAIGCEEAPSSCSVSP